MTELPMRAGTLRFLHLAAWVLASATLSAQDHESREPNDAQAMVLLGVGQGATAGYAANAVGLEGRLVLSGLVFGLHYFELNEMDPGPGVDPAQSVGDFSLLGGITGNTGCGLRWSVVSGLSYIGGRRRSAELEFTEVDQDGNVRDHYVSDKFDSVGLPLEATIDFFICHRFGLSAIGFSNLNPVNSYAGWMVGFRWGGRSGS